MIDSGWNCTPCKGSDACRMDITIPESDRPVTTNSSGSDASSTVSE